MNVFSFLGRDPNRDEVILSLEQRTKEGILEYKDMHTGEMDSCPKVLLAQRFEKNGKFRDSFIVPFKATDFVSHLTDDYLSPCPLKFDKSVTCLDTSSRGTLFNREMTALKTSGFVRQELADYDVEYLKFDLTLARNLRA